MAITRQDFAQLPISIQIGLKDLSAQLLSEDVAVTTGFCSIQLPMDDHILAGETARLVLIFRKEAVGWQITHSSISIPYHLVRDGEVYPRQGLVLHNKQLEDLVTERTAELEARNQDLQLALEQVKTLKGLVPIGASCKKIRDDGGFWHQVETYVREHTEAEFTHGICPDCVMDF